jgi:hypothetical protein
MRAMDWGWEEVRDEEVRLVSSTSTTATISRTAERNGRWHKARSESAKQGKAAREGNGGGS